MHLIFTFPTDGVIVDTPMQFPLPHIHRVSLSGSFCGDDSLVANFGFGVDFAFGLDIYFGAGFRDFGELNEVADLIDEFDNVSYDFMDDRNSLDDEFDNVSYDFMDDRAVLRREKHGRWSIRHQKCENVNVVLAFHTGIDS